MSEMSTCAFCGGRRLGTHRYLAHRMTPVRLRTVGVCPECVEEATDAGYFVTEDRSQTAARTSRRRGLSGLQRYQ
jgi:hypothetical protein